MQCPKCGAENTGNRSACWHCFAQLDEGSGTPRLITLAQPEHVPIKSARPSAAVDTPAQQQDSDTPAWLQTPAPAGEVEQEQPDQSKYIVPGLAAPTAQQPDEPEAAEEDHSPWKTNPVEQPRPAYGPASGPMPSAPATAPDGVNWGGFLLPFWWSIAHKAWLWMVVSIFVPLVAAVVLLITGNKVAWQNRKFASVDEFKKVQKAWTIWGLAINGVGILVSIVMWASIMAMILGAMKNGQMPPGMSPGGFPPGINMKGGMGTGPQGMPNGMMKGVPGMPKGFPGMMKGPGK